MEEQVVGASHRLEPIRANRNGISGHHLVVISQSIFVFLSGPTYHKLEASQQLST